MEIIAKTGKEGLASVYLAKTTQGKLIEFVESIQPPLSREEKWVLIVSTLYGCPVGCGFCDAGDHYHGKISKEDLINQIDYLIKLHYPEGHVPAKKFKIQFARMGEPSFNPAVLEVLESLPEMYQIPGFVPSISTVAPNGTDAFFDKLMETKKAQYRSTFQLQFSIHTTDPQKRNWLIPIKTWSFGRIAKYGERFYDEGGKKITLNFVLSDELPFDANMLSKYFSPAYFIIKLSPLNPTFNARKNQMHSAIHKRQRPEAMDILTALGYEVILNIGEWEENKIGSNCGQYVSTLNRELNSISNAYTYPLQKTNPEHKI